MMFNIFGLNGKIWSNQNEKLVIYPGLKSRMLNDNNLGIYMSWRNVMYCSLSTLLCDEGAIISKPISFKNFHAK